MGHMPVETKLKLIASIEVEIGKREQLGKDTWFSL